MGGKESRFIEHSQEGLRRFEQNFQFVKAENDPRFGKVKIYQERTSGKFIAVQSKISEDGVSLQALKNEITGRVNLNHSNVAKVVGYSTKDEENLCGKSQTISIYSEWFEHDLELEIDERIPKKDYFSEQELWYMTQSMISAGAFFQLNGLYHGDIRPVNMMMNEEGNLLLNDHGLLNEFKDNYNKAFTGKKIVYLTPVQLENLKSKNQNPSYDANKADVFSLGMSLIFAANLENPINCYDWSKKIINKATLDQHLQAVQLNYSPQLYSLIASMVHLDDSQRPDFNQLSLASKSGVPLLNKAPVNAPIIANTQIPFVNRGPINPLVNSTAFPLGRTLQAPVLGNSVIGQRPFVSGFQNAPILGSKAF